MKQRVKLSRRGVIAAVLCVALLGAGAILWGMQSSEKGSVKPLQEVEYQQTAQFPRREDYLDENGNLNYDAFYSQMEQFHGDGGSRASSEYVYEIEALDGFFSDCAQYFLADSGRENRVISPLSLYFVLDILAETTAGTSQQQILDALGLEQMERLRRQATPIWNNNYRNNGLSANMLANAIWLNEDVAFHADTLQRLAEQCHTASYQVTMGSKEADEAYRAWLDERTGGLLSDQTAEKKLDARNAFAITSTLYFHDNWTEKFEEENTKPAVFHGVNRDVMCDFMNQTFFEGRYYWGTKFTAVRQRMNDDHWMFYVLPDEGFTVDDLLADEEYLTFAARYTVCDNAMGAKVNLSVPKFDISSDLDLGEGLQKMGITDIFSQERADFSELTTSDVCLTEAKQTVRLMIDETGCTAGAITELQFGGGGPKEEVDFVLDRPFLFIVTNRNDLPLFMGVVNQPG